MNHPSIHYHSIFDQFPLISLTHKTELPIILQPSTHFPASKKFPKISTHFPVGGHLRRMSDEGKTKEERQNDGTDSETEQSKRKDFYVGTTETEDTDIEGTVGVVEKRKHSIPLSSTNTQTDVSLSVTNLMSIHGKKASFGQIWVENGICSDFAGFESI